MCSLVPEIRVQRSVRSRPRVSTRSTHTILPKLAHLWTPCERGRSLRAVGHFEPEHFQTVLDEDGKG